MAVIKINRNPSARELSWFGVIVLALFGVIGGLVYWRSGSLTAPAVLWSIGAVFFVVYYAVAPVRRLAYVGWMHAIYPIGWTISHLILAVVYFVVLTPIAVCMRLLGRDPMQRKLDPSAATYWIPHDPPGDTQRYFRQF